MRGYARILLVVLLVWAVAATGMAAKLYLENRALVSQVSSLEAQLAKARGAVEGLRSKTVVVDVAVDYGNGTVVWHNGTVLPKGATALTALIAVARAEYRYGKYGAYVVAVDGVKEKMLSKSEGYSWMWYYYDAGKKRWVLGPVAADKYKLVDGAVIMWKYAHWKY